MKNLTFLTLSCLFCFFVHAIEMSTYEKRLFEQNLTSSIDGNGSGFQMWLKFFYGDDTEFRKPGHEYTGGTGWENYVQNDYSHETQGILHTHHYDDNGELVIDNWILIKNDYVDIFSWDQNDIFSPADELKLNYKDSGGKYMDGDFYYEGYLGHKKSFLIPTNQNKLILVYDDDKSADGFSEIEISKRYDSDGLEMENFNGYGIGEHDWSYVSIFPKNGLVFKPAKKINKIEGNFILGNDKNPYLKRSYTATMEALEKQNDSQSTFLRYSQEWKTMVEKASSNEGGLSDYCIQGGMFSPNGRFFFNVHDGEKDKADYIGVYIYYVPDKAYHAIRTAGQNSGSGNLEFYLIGFISIQESMTNDTTGGRDRELEGLDIFPAKEGEYGVEYDIHLLVLNNNSSKEYYAVYHYVSNDYDGDGNKDVYDNCPFTYNPSQKDSDGDGIGDICDDDDDDEIIDIEDNCPNIHNPDQKDSDGDGWGDECDNCPDAANPDQKDSDGDRAGDVCDKCEGFDDNQDRDKDGIPDGCDKCDGFNDKADRDKDGVPDDCDNCPDDPNPERKYELNSEFILAQNGGAYYKGFCTITRVRTWDSREICMMQPDSDLDGIGDACDFGNTGDGFANSKIRTAFSPLKPTGLRTMEANPSINILLLMPKYSGRGLNFCKNSKMTGTTCDAAVHYCAITKRQKDENLWGTPGYCSTTEKEGGSAKNETNFGYSHGSDDFSDRSIESWKSRISVANSVEETKAENWSSAEKFVNSNDPNDDPVRKLVKVNSQLKNSNIIWNWRRDWYERSDCLGANQGSDLCQNLLNGGDYDKDNTMYAAVSTSIVPVENNKIPPYMLSFTLPENDTPTIRINDGYFPPTNTNKFARAARYNIDPIELNYFTVEVSLPNPNSDIIFQKPVELPNVDQCASCYFDMPIRYFGINEIAKEEYISRYEIKKESQNKVMLDSQRIIFPKNQIAFSEISPTEIIGIMSDEKEYFLAVNTSESGADWNRIGRIENWNYEIGEIESWSANYFIAKNAQGVKNLYSIDLVGEIAHNADCGELSEKIYAVNNLGEIGFDQEQTKLVFANGRLYLLRQSENGFGTYLHNGKIFEEIQGVMPQQRKIVNVSVSGRYIFLAGGTDFNNETMNDLWRFDTEANTWEQIPVTLQCAFSKVILQEADGKIVGFNPVIDDNTAFPVFEFENLEDVENIEVSYYEVKIENLDFAQTFCISETGNSIFPGITNVYGECVKVENYDFDEITFPDYKLSVAGYKNSLYLGGLTGIRRLEIGENGEITKKEMIYSGESNNLAVYGRALYATNYSEIDIFEIAEDGSVSRKSSIKTNNCENIRIDGGKLFAAESKRIRIFDLNDPIAPKLVKTISLSNTVEDLEVTDNKLFAYENLNGLLTRNGKISVFDVSDIDNPQKVKEFSQYCNDPEMQKSGNGVYLGCKNGSFKVEETGLQKVNGSKNYLREGYVFDGILYQVFSGTLHESSVEFDEIEEDGWF